MSYIKPSYHIPWVAAATGLALLAHSPPAQASSHMDAPLITLDDAANTTDVYSFVTTSGGVKYLTTALAVYPFEEPGIGPNNFMFDPNVNYEIHVSLGDDRLTGKSTLVYSFTFRNDFKPDSIAANGLRTGKKTILESFLGRIENVGDANQNLVQKYTVVKFDLRKPVTDADFATLIATELNVPPNNQGRVTPYYNQPNSSGVFTGDNPARGGVTSTGTLDRYTAQTVFNRNGYRLFAGQRDDGFYADINSIFDGLNFRTSGSFDSQAGFNVHTIVLGIPVSELGGDAQVVGVYAATNRAPLRIISVTGDEEQENEGLRWAQVGRQGNPLFCEGFIAVEDKDRYNRTTPESDSTVFRKYAENPELGVLVNALNLQPGDPVITTGRTDLSAIFIPDLIKTDLSTGPAKLAGGGPTASTPDDAGFSRLGIFGSPRDTLVSRVQTIGGGFGNNIPGGWPNGRRFGDDVVDIALIALLSDLRPIFVPGYNATPLQVDMDGAGLDRVSSNDIAYNKQFPYAATPHNGRNHKHP